jgi:maltooligosyltrehalose trehalohydrolase
LVEAVRRGRREEFKKFSWQGEPPDPQDEATFARSKLNAALAVTERGRVLQEFHKTLLELRRHFASLGCRSQYPAQVVADEVHRIARSYRTSGTEGALVLYYFGNGVETTADWPTGRWTKRFDSADVTWAGPGCLMPGELVSNGKMLVKMPPRSFAVYIASEQEPRTQ